jgi:hypothetical protein
LVRNESEAVAGEDKAGSFDDGEAYSVNEEVTGYHLVTHAS